jgi:hypothetical protein
VYRIPKSPLSAIFFDVFNYLFGSFIFTIIWLSIREEHNSCLVGRLFLQYLRSVHDEIDTLDQSIIDIGTTLMPDCAYKIKKFLAILVVQLGKIVRYADAVIKKNQSDTIS